MDAVFVRVNVAGMGEAVVVAAVAVVVAAVNLSGLYSLHRTNSLARCFRVPFCVLPPGAAFAAAFPPFGWVDAFQGVYGSRMSKFRIKCL